jgi:putative membrane protein
MEHKNFWHEIFLANTSVTPGIKWRIGIFGFIATVIWAVGTSTNLIPTSDIAPYELIGAALAVLLMLRTNTGYDRWYEGRKLWGGIVNQSRNIAQIGLAYGPEDAKWRDKFVRWTAAFSHSCRHSLRGQTSLEDMRVLLDDEEIDALAKAQHKPMFVAQRLAKMLRQAVDNGQMDRFAFMEAEQQRCLLIDHVGACERIMKTPLAKALSVKIRRFLFLYLCALPFGIFDRADFMTPFIVMLVAYPLLALDQISVELQNPFSQSRVSHLPLDDICRTIQTNVLAMLDEETDVETVDEEKTPIRRAKLAV